MPLNVIGHQKISSIIYLGKFGPEMVGKSMKIQNIAPLYLPVLQKWISSKGFLLKPLLWTMRVQGRLQLTMLLLLFTINPRTNHGSSRSWNAPFVFQSLSRAIKFECYPATTSFISMKLMNGSYREKNWQDPFILFEWCPITKSLSPVSYMQGRRHTTPYPSN